MYKLIRSIHSYSGLLLVLFVVMYFGSGLLMIAGVDHEEVETERYESAMASPSEAGPQDVAAALEDEFGIRGRRLAPWTNDAGTHLEWTRPGTRITALVPASPGPVVVTRETGGFAAKSIELHSLHGYGGGLMFAVWAFLYDLVSLSMILFSVTGIYMWYIRTKDRRLGWALLGLSWTFTVGITAWLWMAP